MRPNRVKPGPTAKREGPVGQPCGGTIGDMDVADKPTWTYLRACPATGLPRRPARKTFGVTRFGRMARSYPNRSVWSSAGDE